MTGTDKQGHQGLFSFIVCQICWKHCMAWDVFDGIVTALGGPCFGNLEGIE